jgi:Tfp pilus assembly protein PilO
MSKLFVPLILLIASVGLFFGFIDPTYESIKTLQDEEAKYDEALTKSKELQALRDQLLAKYNSFTESDLERLEKLLPDNVDNVRLILDLDSIASAYGIKIKNMQVQREGATTQAGTVGPSQKPYESVVLSFRFSASYDNLSRFLNDLESSLRIVDVTKLTFTQPSGDLYDFSVSIRTYWLR